MRLENHTVDLFHK